MKKDKLWITFACPDCRGALRVERPLTVAKHATPTNALTRFIRRRMVSVYSRYDEWKLGSNITRALIAHWIMTCRSDPLDLNETS